MSKYVWLVNKGHDPQIIKDNNCYRAVNYLSLKKYILKIFLHTLKLPICSTIKIKDIPIAI